MRVNAGGWECVAGVVALWCGGGAWRRRLGGIRHTFARPRVTLWQAHVSCRRKVRCAPSAPSLAHDLVWKHSVSLLVPARALVRLWSRCHRKRLLQLERPWVRQGFRMQVPQTAHPSLSSHATSSTVPARTTALKPRLSAG